MSGPRLRFVARERRRLVPASQFANRLVEHYSLPAFDAVGGSLLEDGATIASDKLSVAEGQVLISKLNPRIPRVLTVGAKQADAECSVCSTEFVVLEPRTASGAYLCWWLGSRAVAHQLDSGVKSATRSQQRVLPEDILNLRLPERLARHEQDKVADFLDRECERIAVAVAAVDAAAGRLATVERAIADTAVGTTRSVPLKAVATIHSGVTLNESKTPSDAVMKPYLRVANVKAGWLDLEEVKEVPATPSVVARSKLLRGDLLLTEGGDLDKLGRGALWEEQLPECLFQNHVFAVRSRAELAVPGFLAWATRSSSARTYFEATASRITNLASTNKAKLGRWLVPDLPIDEQQRRVAAADAAWRNAATAAASAAAVIASLAEYRDSLIHEAVTGKLDVSRVPDAQMDERLHAAAENRLDEVA